MKEFCCFCHLALGSHEPGKITVAPGVVAHGDCIKKEARKNEKPRTIKRMVWHQPGR